MGLFYSHFDVNFEGLYKDGYNVHIFYEFDVKRNFTYLFFTSDDILVRSINHFIDDILRKNIYKSSMYEGHDIRRLIDDDVLEALNNTLNGAIHTWVPKDIKIKNLQITHLI